MILAVVLAASCASPALTGIKVHIQNGEYEDAVHLADSVIAGGEDQNADIWLWRGRALGSLRDYAGAAESFVRGDANQDAQITISDGIFVARSLFDPAVPAPVETGCADALDTNDDGGVDLSDVIWLLEYMFAGGAPVPPPFPATGPGGIAAPDCGSDPTADALTCPSYVPCQ